MAQLLQDFTQLTQEFIRFAWLPVTIWTFVSAVVIGLLKAAPNIHSQYHYHIRLALIIALPLGLLFSQIADMIATYFSEPAALTLISMISPVEVELGTESADIILTGQLILSGFGFILIAGILWFSGSRLTQWIQLHILRLKLPIIPIIDYPHLSSHNRLFASKVNKPIFIGISGHNFIPVTFGVIKPVILIPESLSGHPAKVNLAIRHELTHIQQHDFGVHLLVSTIQSFFWFHPLIHLLANQVTEYREMRCDSLIIADSSVSRKEYASLLFELLPMPNLNQKVSVNMAQQSSNLKERIDRINNQPSNHIIPTRSSITILSTLLIALIIGMACTDLQTQAVFDNEELDLMTDVDRTGDRGYHQVLIFLGEEGQSERHEHSLTQLNQLRPEHIKSINILKGEAANEKYGDRAKYGVIEIQTKQDPESYNIALKALGMEAEMPPSPPKPGNLPSGNEDYFVVVEEMPKLIGGLASIQENITYPEMAKRAGIEGRVYVQFIVDSNGDVINPKVVRGIGGGADEAALDAVRNAKFEPGLQKGKPVNVQYSLPVIFRLQNENSQ